MKHLMQAQLDKRLSKIRADKAAFTRPSSGWIRSIREALGMTATQLAERIGVSVQRVSKAEKDEVEDSLTISSLREIARGLDCELVYVLLPKRSLTKMIEDRAKKLAIEKVNYLGHTMGLEDQALNAKEKRRHFEELKRDYIAYSGKKLWEGDDGV